MRDLRHVFRDPPGRSTSNLTHVRAGLLIALGVTLLAAIACVPDFAFRDGTETSGGGREGDGGDGDGGRRRPGGDGGGDRRPDTTGGLATSDMAGPAGSTSSGGQTTVSVSSGGDGGSGQGTPTSTSSAAATSSASTGSGGTAGVPCWDGDIGQVVTCDGSESACCAAKDAFMYDECGVPGNCQDPAYELECNEHADCGAQLCCVTTDGSDALVSIGCAASCSDFEACDPSVGCDGGRTCTLIPPLQHVAHPEYEAYGYCN